VDENFGLIVFGPSVLDELEYLIEIVADVAV